MKMLLLLSIFLVPVVQAESVNMRPGLWQVEMLMKGPDGKEVNPAAVIQEALAKIPEEKKKEVMEMMAKMNPGSLNASGVKMCYTEAMIKDPESLARHDDEKCKTKVISKSSKIIKSTFKCEDGANGEVIWTIKNPSAYEGKVNINAADGSKTAMTYKGKYLSKECGSTKPLN